MLMIKTRAATPGKTVRPCRVSSPADVNKATSTKDERNARVGYFV